MANYAQILNVSPIKTPEVLPSVPVIHSGEPSWGDIAGTALEGAGAIMHTVGGQMKEQEKASAKAAETMEGNNYAREMQRLVARREQTGNRTQFEQSVRALNDAYLSRGVLKADKLATIRNSYDEGYLDINEKSRERWAKYDDEAQLKVIQEMQSKYSHLKGKKTSDILRDYNRITNSLDFAIELQNRMNTLDPVKYPDEHERLKTQRDSFFESNVTGQVLESIAEDLHNNTDMFKDPVKVEQYKQSLVAFLTRQKVALNEASIIAETALSRAGAYSLYDNDKAILGVSKQNMQDVIDYRKTQADYAIDTEYPELVLQSQLIKTMDPETFKAFANTVEGQKTVKALASNFKAAAEGINQYVTDFSDKGQAANMASALQRTDAPVILKGSSAVSVAQSINDVPSIADLPDRDFDAVISNARGVSAFFSNPHTQATKQLLLSSNKPNEKAVGMQMDAEERHAKALSNAGVYLQSATEGGQNLRYIMQRSTIGNNLRVNNKGQLVFVPGSSPIAAVAEGVAEQFEGYGNMIDTINSDVQATTGLTGQGLIDFYKALGIPELSSGERVQGAPAFNWTSKKSEADEIRERVERLKEQKKHMSSVALKEYGKGLDADIKAAEDWLKNNDKIVSSSRISNSETLAFAKLDYSNKYPDAEIWKTVEESSAADTRAAQGLSEYDTELGAAVKADEEAERKQETIDSYKTPEEIAILADIVNQIESSGDDSAKSSKGAIGGMQLMPDTYKDTAKKHGLPLDGINNPQYNKIAGELYLQELYNKYDGDVEKTLAAYNYGRGKVDKILKEYGNSWKRYLPTETKNYLKKYYKILSEGAW